MLQEQYLSILSMLTWNESSPGTQYKARGPDPYFFVQEAKLNLSEGIFGIQTLLSSSKYQTKQRTGIEHTSRFILASRAAATTTAFLAACMRTTACSSVLLLSCDAWHLVVLGVCDGKSESSKSCAELHLPDSVRGLLSSSSLKATRFSGCWMGAVWSFADSSRSSAEMVATWRNCRSCHIQITPKLQSEASTSVSAANTGMEKYHCFRLTTLVWASS